MVTVTKTLIAEDLIGEAWIVSSTKYIIFLHLIVVVSFNMLVNLVQLLNVQLFVANRANQAHVKPCNL